MNQITQALAWLHAHLVVALLIFLPLSLVATEVFRKRDPVADAELKAKYPKLIAVRDLVRGLGWDGPKIRMALSVLLFGKPWDPLVILDGPPSPAPPPAPAAEVTPITLRGGDMPPPPLDDHHGTRGAS